MKRFIYFDQDSINSYLAQIEKGLNTSNEEESQISQSETDEDTLGTIIKGNIGAKLFGIGADVASEIATTENHAQAAEEIVRNVQEKVLHDYSFDLVFDYVNQNNLVKTQNIKIGDVISKQNNITFLDFEYFKTLFEEDGAIKFSYNNTKRELLAAKKSIPKGQQIPNELKKQLDVMDAAIKESEDERKIMLQTIIAIQNTLPYNRFVLIDDCLVTLNDKNFRDDPNVIGFKYGGEISIIGHVTNIIEESKEEKQYTNDFAPLYNTVNEIMLTLFKNRTKIYIVHPIAMYY